MVIQQQQVLKMELSIFEIHKKNKLNFHQRTEIDKLQPLIFLHLEKFLQFLLMTHLFFYTIFNKIFQLLININVKILYQNLLIFPYNKNYEKQHHNLIFNFLQFHNEFNKMIFNLFNYKNGILFLDELLGNQRI